MFRWLARGTVAERSEVVITRVPLTVACDDCAAEFHIDVHDRSTWHCPSCGCERYHLKTGMEFFISEIEVASPAPAPSTLRGAEPSFEELDALRARIAAHNRAVERDAAAGRAAEAGDAAKTRTPARQVLTTGGM